MSTQSPPGAPLRRRKLVPGFPAGAVVGRPLQPLGAKPTAGEGGGAESKAVASARSVLAMGQLLNTQIERINAGFAAVADAFKKARITVRATTKIKTERESSDDGHSWDIEWYLTWGKHAGGWGFYIDRWVPDFERSDVSPISSANREIRAIAAKCLPALYEALNAEMAEQLNELTEAADAIAVFRAELPETVEELDAPADDESLSRGR